ncbi:MAG: organic hydroperoxide resistance protein [Pseudomonadota bacterium]
MTAAASTEDKVLYTGRTHTTGGRTGASRSDDGRLDIALTRFGTVGQGTNPEQLFAAGWSACFMGAMARAAQAEGVRLPDDLAVDAEVDLVQGPDGFALAARLKVSVPGVDRDKALAIVEGAHQLCPYSKATRGNIAVDLSVA